MAIRIIQPKKNSVLAVGVVERPLRDHMNGSCVRKSLSMAIRDEGPRSLQCRGEEKLAVLGVVREHRSREKKRG